MKQKNLNFQFFHKLNLCGQSTCRCCCECCCESISARINHFAGRSDTRIDRRTLTLRLSTQTRARNAHNDSFGLSFAVRVGHRRTTFVRNRSIRNRRRHYFSALFGRLRLDKRKAQQRNYLEWAQSLWWLFLRCLLLWLLL